MLQVVLCCVFFQPLSHLLGSIEYTVSIIMLYFIPKAGNLELLRNKFASHCLYAVLEFNGSDYRYTELSYKITSLISRMCGLVVPVWRICRLMQEWCHLNQPELPSDKGSNLIRGATLDICRGPTPLTCVSRKYQQVAIGYGITF